MADTMPDSTAPVALKARLRRQCGWPRWRRRCMIMPAWDRVNARKTPTAYSGSRDPVLPRKTT